jgi:cobalt-precorrin-5B (C1)-methyltransferase
MGRRPEGELRRGWTTGACATAATKAAYLALLAGRFPDPVTIRLPGGEQPSFPLAERGLEIDAATAAVIKDAGDDPDVTHGALIRVRVRRLPRGSGVLFVAGDGIGVVTRPGLPVPVGEPAINPGPRAMMREVIEGLAESWGDGGDVEITVSIPGGAALAKQTMNARLGIVGGLSVLGTTGIVIPYSCASWIHAIHRGIDVARAAGLDHIAAATGSTSERAVQALYDLPEIALVDMGDFVGGTLKYLRQHPIPRLSIAGGFAKLAKLADGHLDLHSSRSSARPAGLAALLQRRGAPGSVIASASGADSANQVLDLARQHSLPLADDVAAQARAVAAEQLRGRVAVEVLVFDRSGQLVGEVPG